MITIQSVMLVALGFLVAALIALLVAPAYRRRAARLTTEAMKRAMPLTEAEIRADRDRLRAEYAIAIHRLEMKVSEANVSAARQRIELNRRDATISDLEGGVSTMRTQLEEHENARRVLEQTLIDRLPKVEGRLTDAKKMLMQRDREITALGQSADKQARALEETTQINTQQRDEIQRLNSALATRAARNKESVADSRFDSEVALRSEIEALRAKNRDQASHIVRLQGLISRRTASAADLHGLEARSAELAGAPAAEATIGESTGEVERLRGALREAEAALKAAQTGPQDPALDGEMRSLRAANEDLATEIARLKAAVASYQTDDGDEGRDSRLGMKAQLNSLKVQAEEQAATIQRLRAEVATGNERLSRQSQHFRDELRRMGAGTVPAAPAAELTRNPSDTTGRRSLAARISEPRGQRADEAADAPAPPPAETPRQPAPAFLKALDGGARNANEPAAQDVAAANAAASNLIASMGAAPTAVVPMTPSLVTPPVAPVAPSPSAVAPAPAPAATAAAGGPLPVAQAAPQVPAKPAEAPRRPRLMERLSAADKSS